MLVCVSADPLAVENDRTLLSSVRASLSSGSRSRMPQLLGDELRLLEVEGKLLADVGNGWGAHQRLEIEVLEAAGEVNSPLRLR